MDQFNHPESEKHISTTIGVTIIVLVVIVVALVYWRFKIDSDSAFQEVMSSPVAEIKKIPKVEVPIDSPAASPGSSISSLGETLNVPIDFDQEIKDLDSSVSSANSNDFGDSDLSDSNLGI